MGSRRAIDVDAHVAVCIRTARKEREMTMQALAKLVGVTYQQIGKYEQKKNPVSLTMLFKIAKALKCSVVSLLPEEAQ